MFVTIIIKNLFLVCSLVISLCNLQRGLLQLRGLTHSKFIQCCFYFGVVLFFMAAIWHTPLWLEKVSLSIITTSFLAIFILIFCSKITTQKDKTLWRLPLIGALLSYLAFYLALEHYVFIFFSLLQLCLMLFSWKKKEFFLYVHRQQVKIVAFTSLAVISYFYIKDWYYLFLLPVFYLMIQIINAIKLKILMMDKSIES